MNAAGQSIEFDTFVLHDLYVESRNANLKYKIYKAKMEGNSFIELLDCDTYTVEWLKGLFGSKVESTYNRNRKADVKITF